MIGHWELTDKSGKTCENNVQDVKITYPFDEFIKYLPDEKAFGHPAMYHTHPQCMEVCWSINPNPDILGHSTWSPSSTTKNSESTQNMSGPTTSSQSSCAGADKQLHMPKCNSHHALLYNLHLWKVVAPNK